MKPYQVCLQELNSVTIKSIQNDSLNLQNRLINIKVNFTQEKNKCDGSKQDSCFCFANIFFWLENGYELHTCYIEIADHYQFNQESEEL